MGEPVAPAHQPLLGSQAHSERAHGAAASQRAPRGGDMSSRGRPKSGSGDGGRGWGSIGDQPLLHFDTNFTYICTCYVWGCPSLPWLVCGMHETCMHGNKWKHTEPPLDAKPMLSCITQYAWQFLYPQDMLEARGGGMTPQGRGVRVAAR